MAGWGAWGIPLSFGQQHQLSGKGHCQPCPQVGHSIKGSHSQLGPRPSAQAAETLTRLELKEGETEGDRERKGKGERKRENRRVQEFSGAETHSLLEC